MTPTTPQMGTTEWLLLVTLSILWGGSFFFVEVALTDFGPLTTVLGRVGIAAVALLLMVRATGHVMPRDARTWGVFTVMGLLNNAIPFGLIVWGQVYISAGLASILNATTPIFAVLLAHWLTRDERLSAGRGIGVSLGLLGVVVLVGPEALDGLSAQVLGEIAVVGAAISYAFAGIWGRRLASLPAPVSAAGMLCASTVLMAPPALLVERPWESVPGFAAVASVAGLALLSTAVAYLIYFRILRVAGATNLLLVTFLVPPSAIALGIVFLGEALTGAAVLGMLLIFGGLVAVDGRFAAAIARRSERG